VNEVILASGNRGKLVELNALISELDVTFRAQSDFDVPEAQEIGLSFVENAIIKARNAALFTKRPALADDSGISVDALNGAPGIYSARYAGEAASDHENLNLLLERTNHLPESQRQCQFICLAVFVRHASDPMPIIAEGVWKGVLLHEPRGANGFGYDPIFRPNGMEISSAELDPKKKNKISHRGLAMRQMVDYFRQEFTATISDCR
jgi:XTP/dITP diphosphohydrolase